MASLNGRVIDGKKLCSKCKEVKEVTAFNRNSRVACGYSSWCKSCLHRVAKVRSDSVDINDVVRSDGTRECISCKQVKSLTLFNRNKFAPSGREVTCKLCRNIRLWYRMLPDEYHRLEEKQGGVCAICGQIENTLRSSRLTVDHDHETSEVRGLLCSHCNAGLGNFRDNIALLENALEYMRAAHTGIFIDARPQPRYNGKRRKQLAS